MNLHSLSVNLFYALAIAHIECQSFSSDSNSQSGLQQQGPTHQKEPDRAPPPPEQPLKEPSLHPRMSCYVCSTMEYANPHDNLCRVASKSHTTTPSPEQYTPNNNNKLVTNSPNYRPSTPATATATTTTTAVTMTESTTAMLTNNGVGHGHHHESSGAGSFTPTESYYNNNNQETTLSGMVDGSGNATSNQLQKSILSNIMSGSNYEASNPPPDNVLRTRRCHEDENFCSVVSVVKIEYHEDKIRSRFWALERNCSRSCNSGCMFIGERYRLKVCSRCCNEPNCNILASGSNLSPIQSISQSTILPLMLALIFVIRFSIMSDRHGAATVFRKIKGD